MRLHICVIGFTLLLIGCGNGPAASHAGFVNATQHSDTELWQIWKQAQDSISTRIDLNPLQQAPPVILRGDRRAITVQPNQLWVAPVNDISAQTLFKETGTHYKSPSGLIVCPQPCDVRFAPAYSTYQPPAVKYAASWETAGSNFDQLLQYEFENQILYALKYDVTWR
ncbi:MAG TPA: hypothetical protein VF753_00300 [Terriglobales bacterium]